MAKETIVTLPTLHPGQVRAYNLGRASRLVAVRCGRRWGKSLMAEVIVGDASIKRKLCGFFAPDYKRISEIYNEIAASLNPVIGSSSRTAGAIRTRTGGRVDFWTLNDPLAGRSRMYHEVIIDEAAFTEKNMMDIWRLAIKPTLFDFSGRAWVFSNTNGVDPENFFWRICNQPEHGFVEYHAPTEDNPHVPRRMPGESDVSYFARRKQEFDNLIRDNPPLVYQQEHLAEWVDWSGVAFFDKQKFLVDGVAPPIPVRCDAVFAIVDTATKTGQTHDGTAVTYFAKTNHGGHPLMILDWDIQQIEGALLETWLPTIFKNLEFWAKTCGARSGSVGTWIEDKSSGMVLLQHAKRKGWPAQPIDSKLSISWEV